MVYVISRLTSRAQSAHDYSQPPVDPLAGGNARRERL
jgi:hypothetical protein